MIVSYSKDDESYRKWLLKNPLGFVLNGNNPETQSYQMLHRADCHTILRPITDGHQLTVGYLKRCSVDRSELEASTITHCKFCLKAGRL